MLLAAFLADARDHGALDPADDVSSIVEFLDRGDDGLDFRLAGVRFHYNNHVNDPSAEKLGIATEWRQVRRRITSGWNRLAKSSIYYGIVWRADGRMRTGE